MTFEELLVQVWRRGGQLKVAFTEEKGLLMLRVDAWTPGLLPAGGLRRSMVRAESKKVLERCKAPEVILGGNAREVFGAIGAAL